MSSTVLLLFLAFQAKHFVVDFLLQPPWMYKNKGRYGHPGGLAHAFLHGLVSYIILLHSDIDHLTVSIVVYLEVVIHYHMDWFKMWYGKRKDWHHQTEAFWMFLGFDQFVYQLTYLFMVYFLMNFTIS